MSTNLYMPYTSRFAASFIALGLIAFLAPSAAFAATAFSVPSKFSTNGKISYELSVPPTYGGDYVVFIINPRTGTMPSGELSYVALPTGWQGTRILGSLSVASEHITDASGVEHWYKLPAGYYSLTAVVYQHNPFTDTKGMVYRKTNEQPVAVITGPVIGIPGIKITFP